MEVAVRDEPPTIGRIIHFVPAELGRDLRAGIITAVHPDGACDLSVFNPADRPNSLPCPPVETLPRVEQDPAGLSPRTWHFPKRKTEVIDTSAIHTKNAQQQEPAARGAAAPADEQSSARTSRNAEVQTA